MIQQVFIQADRILHNVYLSSGKSSFFFLKRNIEKCFILLMYRTPKLHASYQVICTCVAISATTGPLRVVLGKCSIFGL